MPKDNKKKQFPIHIVTGVLLAAVIVLLCIPVGVTYMQRMEARQVLRHGKNLYLAAEVTALELSANNIQFLDGSRECGVSKKAEKELIELTRMPGTFRIGAWSVDAAGSRQLWYLEGDYVACLDYQDSTHLNWSVYHVKTVLDHAEAGA